MKTNKITTNNDEENIEKVYEPETVIKLLNYIESAMDSWLRNKQYNDLPLDEDVVDDSGFAYLNICKDNVKFMKIIMKSYYINDKYDGGENEKR
jgi:hypothetical protein